MASVMCTNPECKFPGERYNDDYPQQWCPACGWPTAYLCPECKEELTKQIIKNKQCRCGADPREEFCLLHLCGSLLTRNPKGELLKFAQDALASEFSPYRYPRMMTVFHRSELQDFWQNNEDVYEMVYHFLVEKGIFDRDNVISLLEYRKKKS